MLCLAVTVTEDNLFAQLLLITAQSMIAVMIFTYIKPYPIGILRNEIFNEVILVFLMYMIICLSKFVPSLELKFQIGYGAIGLVGLHLFYHMTLMTITTIRTQIIRFKRWRRFRQYKFQRAALQKRLKDTHAKRFTRIRKIRNHGKRLGERLEKYKENMFSDASYESSSEEESDSDCSYDSSEESSVVASARTEKRPEPVSELLLAKNRTAGEYASMFLNYND